MTGVSSQCPRLRQVQDLKRYPQVFRDPESPTKAASSTAAGPRNRERQKLKAYGLNELYQLPRVARCRHGCRNHLDLAVTRCSLRTLPSWAVTSSYACRTFDANGPPSPMQATPTPKAASRFRRNCRSGVQAFRDGYQTLCVFEQVDLPIQRLNQALANAEVKSARHRAAALAFLRDNREGMEGLAARRYRRQGRGQPVSDGFPQALFSIADGVNRVVDWLVLHGDRLRNVSDQLLQGAGRAGEPAAPGALVAAAGDGRPAGLARQPQPAAQRGAVALLARSACSGCGTNCCRPWRCW